MLVRLSRRALLFDEKYLFKNLFYIFLLLIKHVHYDIFNACLYALRTESIFLSVYSSELWFWVMRLKTTANAYRANLLARYLEKNERPRDEK